MIRLNFLILFLFVCSFCNAQDEHNFSVQEVDSIIEKNNVLKESGLITLIDGKEISGISFEKYYTYTPTTGNSDKELIKGTHTEHFLYGKYSEESNLELYFSKGKLFFAKLKVTKYKSKRHKKIESKSYEYNVAYEKVNSDIIPDRIKERIENTSKEILERYNSAKHEY